MTPSMYKRLGRFHLLLLHLDLAVLTVFLLPFVLTAERFTKPADRGQLWRRAAAWIVRTVFALNEVDIKIKHAENISLTPVIYAANHPSEMDGFLLLAILGADCVLFTAPLGQFPAILRTWLRKMQTIDVKRDPIDEIRYPEAHSRAEAIEHAIEFLRQGKSLIIFPEGHVEILHLLHYFHTGAARIALGAHAPIVPVAIINADHIFPDSHHLFPGTIIAAFNRPIAVPDKSNDKTTFPKTKVLQIKKTVEAAIAERLPLRYLPNYYRQRDKRTGVFVDVDRTIYKSFSQKDLIAYLLFLHKINAKEAFKIFYWLYLEKRHRIEHVELIKKSLLVLKGWDVNELRREVHEAFNKKMLKKIQYGLYPILKDHAEQNHSLILVSEVIHPLAREFKNLLHANASLDTRLETLHHCYTGGTPCLCYKEQKARLVESFAKRANINLNKSYAYADSHSDVPFLSLVKYPTAVNPDPALLDYAIDHDWQVMLDAS